MNVVGSLFSAIAVVVALLSAIAGVWLAGLDRQSLGFVMAAVVTWVFFALGLAVYRYRVSSAGRAASARSLDDLSRGDWAALAEAIRGGLVKDADGRAVRTRSASALLRTDSPLLSKALHPFPWLPSGQAVLVSIGLFGTFFGLSWGLQNSIPCIDSASPGHQACVEAARLEHPDDSRDDDTLAMERGMSELLHGARTAFSKSVAGVGLGLSYLLLWRLVERRRAQVLAKIAQTVDACHTYRPPEAAAGDALALVVAELRALRASQPDGTALADAGQRLALGADALQQTAARLSGVSESLRDFRAEVIAPEVARGVRGAVEESLAPTLAAISTELRVLRDMKQEQDEVVQRRLQTMVEEFRDEAILPMSREVQQTNVQARAVADAVTRLSGTVAESSAAVRAASEQMTGLTEHLSRFQTDALGQLNEFADDLRRTLDTFTTNSEATFRGMAGDLSRSVDGAERAMERQREAFERSAELAGRAFEAQTEAMQSAGHAASDEIRAAGGEARDALRLVRTEFAEALTSQRGALEGILAALEGSFRRDLEQRERFEQLTENAIRRMQQLLQSTAMSDTQLRQATIEASNQLGRALQDTGHQITAQREALEALQDALSDHLRAAADAHQKFLKEEDQHLFEVLGRLHGLVATVAETTRHVQERNGAHDARA